MTDQWLNELERYLQPMPFEDRFDLVLNYKEQIQIMKESGLSDNEIVNKLGCAKQIAKELADSFDDNSEFVCQEEPEPGPFKTHVNRAPGKEERTHDVLKKLLYGGLFLFYLLAAFCIVVTGFSLLFSAAMILIFTVPFLNLSLSIFFICLSICLFVFNLGVVMIYYPCQLGKYLYRKFVMGGRYEKN